MPWKDPKRKTSASRLFDQENLIPEELTQVKVGRIVKDKFPHLDDVLSKGFRVMKRFGF